MDLLEVKKRITTLRGKLSKKEFAENARINPSYLSQIENTADPQKPSIEALFAISAACDVSIDFILTGRDYNSTGMAENQSFVGVSEMQTPLGRDMFKSMNHLARGIQSFDRIAIKYNNLQALEGTASALSISPETSNAREWVRTAQKVVQA